MTVAIQCEGWKGQMPFQREGDNQEPWKDKARVGRWQIGSSVVRLERHVGVRSVEGLECHCKYPFLSVTVKNYWRLLQGGANLPDSGLASLSWYSELFGYGLYWLAFCSLYTSWMELTWGVVIWFLESLGVNVLCSDILFPHYTKLLDGCINLKFQSISFLQSWSRCSLSVRYCFDIM